MALTLPAITLALRASKSPRYHAGGAVVTSVFDALILSLVPSTIVLSLVYIWESAFGSLPPRLLSPLSQLPRDVVSSFPRLAQHLPAHLLARMQQGVGIDMDQLAAPGLKDGLIRGVLRYTGAASGVAVALDVGWLGALTLLVVARGGIYVVMQVCQ